MKDVFCEWRVGKIVGERLKGFDSTENLTTYFKIKSLFPVN